jgi:hypothetical protein
MSEARLRTLSLSTEPDCELSSERCWLSRIDWFSRCAERSDFDENELRSDDSRLIADSSPRPDERSLLPDEPVLSADSQLLSDDRWLDC